MHGDACVLPPRCATALASALYIGNHFDFFNNDLKFTAMLQTKAKNVLVYDQGVTDDVT